MEAVKKFFKSPGGLILTGILIGAAIVWVSSGVVTKNWNLYKVEPA